MTQEPKFPSSAMVLAAGLGTRMRPLTNEQPKPLIKVAGKALIDYTLDRFAAFGIDNVVVNVHYLADMLEDHLAMRTAPAITISDERETLLETGGGITKALPLLGKDPIFCTNTDAILFDEPIDEACATLARAWDPDHMDALLLLTPHTAASGYDGAGDFHLEGDGRIAWRRGNAAPFIYTGLQIISPALFEGLSVEPFSLKTVWEKADGEGRLHGVVHRGAWMHVGDPEGLKTAEERLAAFRQ